jgi:hypothetical protein
MLQRKSPSRSQASFQSASHRARKFVGEDEEGQRGEFIRLVERSGTSAAA